MKKVIVTGACGFLGRYLIETLYELGYEIWAIVRKENVQVSEIRNKVKQVVVCDLENVCDLRKQIPIDDYCAFYHLAWEGSSGEKRKDYCLQLKNAKICADCVVEAAKLGCKRFVGAGSVTELFYKKYMQEDYSHPEMTACYAVGKIAAAYLAQCICAEQGIDFLWGYISNFYGVGDQSKNFINYLINAYESGDVPELTGGEQKADFLYVSDVAEALVQMGINGKANCFYYIGYGQPVPLKEFVHKVHNMVKPEIPTGLGRKPFYGIDIDYKSIDVQKLYRDTGFVPKVKFEEGIKQTYLWIQNRE